MILRSIAEREKRSPQQEGETGTAVISLVVVEVAVNCSEAEEAETTTQGAKTTSQGAETTSQGAETTSQGGQTTSQDEGTTSQADETTTEEGDGFGKSAGRVN